MKTIQEIEKEFDERFPKVIVEFEVPPKENLAIYDTRKVQVEMTTEVKSFYPKQFKALLEEVMEQDEVYDAIHNIINDL